MEGFFEQYVTGPFGLVVILPIIGVVVSVILVFMFGFKQLDESKFKKFTTSGHQDSVRKSRRKDNKKSSSNVTGGSSAIPGSTTTTEQKIIDRSTTITTTTTKKLDATKKASPLKESKKNKPLNAGALLQKQITTTTMTAAVVPIKLTKRQQQRAEKLSKEKVEKPADYDDGNWLTVPTKADRKKRADDIAATVLQQKIDTILLTATKTGSTAVKITPKQLKDQANKTKKEAADAAAAKNDTKSLQIIAEKKLIVDNVLTASENALSSSSSSLPISVTITSTAIKENEKNIVDDVAKTSSSVDIVDHSHNDDDDDDNDRQTAEIIEQIEDAIVDVDIEDDDDDDNDDDNDDDDVNVIDDNENKKEIILSSIIQSTQPKKIHDKHTDDGATEKSDKIKTGAKINDDKTSTTVKSIVIDSNVAFDELGDTWIEAKVSKKGKKKVRKD